MFLLIPCERITKENPSGSSDGLSITLTPLSSKFLTTSGLWIMDPRVHIFLFFFIRLLVIFMLLSTPKQNP